MPQIGPIGIADVRALGVARASAGVQPRLHRRQSIRNWGSLPGSIISYTIVDHMILLLSVAFIVILLAFFLLFWVERSVSAVWQTATGTANGVAASTLSFFYMVGCGFGLGCPDSPGIVSSHLVTPAVHVPDMGGVIGRISDSVIHTHDTWSALYAMSNAAVITALAGYYLDMTHLAEDIEIDTGLSNRYELSVDTDRAANVIQNLTGLVMDVNCAGSSTVRALSSEFVSMNRQLQAADLENLTPEQWLELERKLSRFSTWLINLVGKLLVPVNVAETEISKAEKMLLALERDYHRTLGDVNSKIFTFTHPFLDISWLTGPLYSAMTVPGKRLANDAKYLASGMERIRDIHKECDAARNGLVTIGKLAASLRDGMIAKEQNDGRTTDLKERLQTMADFVMGLSEDTAKSLENYVYRGPNLAATPP